MVFMTIDFNDGENLTRLVHFKEQNGIFLDKQAHLYMSYGTFYTKIFLRNNISEIVMNYTLEIEQCVPRLEIAFDEDRYKIIKILYH